MDKIKIISQIGSGGFGNVYLCEHKNQRRVIKRVPCEGIEGKHYEYVMSELKILRYCNHPRIITFFDFIHSNNNFNFIMEHATHGSLREFITSYQRYHWKLSQNDLIIMFLDMAFGIKYLHNHNIIHRDLKPENVLLVDDLRCKIADFGISKIVEDSTKAVNQTIIGSICYMSPEVYLSKKYDCSCDVWGLGLIFYELAMMKYAFSRAEKARIMNFNLIFQPPVIDYEKRHYDYRVQSILEGMVQRDPRKRHTINVICNYCWFKNSSYYKELLKEDKKFP